MGALHGKVVGVLRQKCPDLIDGLEIVKETGRVTGWIASGKFRALDDDVRQDRLWTWLEKGLSSDELENVGPIVTLTPAELDIDVSKDRPAQARK